MVRLRLGRMIGAGGSGGFHVPDGLIFRCSYHGTSSKRFHRFFGGDNANQVVLVIHYLGGRGCLGLKKAIQ